MIIIGVDFHPEFQQIASVDSWGGYLVMAYAASHPEHIAHLIIVDSAAPKFKDTIFLFGNVFPEGTERQQSVNFAEEMGDKKAQDTDLREYFSMLFCCDGLAGRISQRHQLSRRKRYRAFRS